MTIGVYPGSFNPFHRGHYNILLKAQEIFDKVIVARGINQEKEASAYDMPMIVKNRAECIEYTGLLTDCLEAIIKKEQEAVLDAKVTIIRGLRNSVDLQYEMNQYRYLQDLKPNIQMVSIFCDKEFEHISSSGIRTLQPFGYDKVKNYLI
jgi:pantetheine-phosphate adenylyltransferase